VPLRAGLETPARSICALAVRGIRSSNRADSLRAGVRSHKRVGASAAVDQARPGHQGSLAGGHGLSAALRQRDGMSDAAPGPDRHRCGLRVLARTASRGQGDRLLMRPLPSRGQARSRDTEPPRHAESLARPVGSQSRTASTTHESEDPRTSRDRMYSSNHYWAVSRDVSPIRRKESRITENTKVILWNT